ncbi:DUF3833 domain-containing protein [Photobacterium sp. NCIMB 13483]|uniref:Lipoprotein n=1 Tax=Photobacterium piscicola TaxID=1378299 RepID=A0A1T5HWJ5_9GAMM|nr:MULTISPECIES: DUF3833 domain-containing protein [Photobacterium]PST94290.1 DUF3833 domain-containing protein [Photobacterium sp. NCIMB 13483]SKC31160.1 hypothetical protein CZ809_00638 [Photobacterium piscicola]
MASHSIYQTSYITLQWLLGCVLALLLNGCTASIEDYEHAEPKFNLFQFFEGRSQAWGMVQDYKGQQVRRFSVELNGVITGNKLVLTEDFVFDDKETQQRVWTITKQANGQYIGTADDVVGEAVGYEKGNALHWQYVLAMDIDGTTYHINFEDWMFYQDNNQLFNVAKMKKWGITVGSVTLFFQK